MITCVNSKGSMVEVDSKALFRKEVNEMSRILKGPREDPPEGTVMDDDGDFST